MEPPGLADGHRQLHDRLQVGEQRLRPSGHLEGLREVELCPGRQMDSRYRRYNLSPCVAAASAASAAGATALKLDRLKVQNQNL